MRSRTCLSELSGPRRRALEAALLIEDASDQPVDARTLAVAVRDALQLLAETGPILIAIDDVQWLDTSSANALVFAVRRLVGAERTRASSSPAGSRTVFRCRSSSFRWTITGSSACRSARSDPGALQAILQDRLGRSVRAADPASPARSIGRECVLRPRARPCPRRRNVDLTQPLPVPENAGSQTRPCSPRRVARQRAERCCSPARTGRLTPAPVGR